MAQITDQAIARVYLEHKSEEKVVVSIPHTSYKLHLLTQGLVEGRLGHRIKGVIRAAVWKVDFVSAGGAYVEPVIGRPRRVQGRVLEAIPADNAIVVEVAHTPFIGMLPPRWRADRIPPGTRVGLDVPDQVSFEPISVTAASHE